VLNVLDKTAGGGGPESVQLLSRNWWVGDSSCLPLTGLPPPPLSAIPQLPLPCPSPLEAEVRDVSFLFYIGVTEF